MIEIVDCGSQLTQNIARRVRELGVYAAIVPFDKLSPARSDLEGRIISGGPFSVYDKGAPLYPKRILESNIPTLGICYGQQSIAFLLGGTVVPTNEREYGDTKVMLGKESLLFKGVPTESTVRMSHGDIVEEAPQGFDVIAVSSGGHIAAMQRGNIYAVQFHPEVDHTEYGRQILDNFLKICNAGRTWDPEKYIDAIIEKTREQVKGKVGVGGISGGVDSTTAAVLLSQITENFYPIFVDNGLLRKDEAEEVRRSLDGFNINVLFVDASERFLAKLRGVTDPDEKRRIIGHEFIAVFDEEAKQFGAEYLLQGTLYPDVIESVPVYGSSSKIKRHHNVGGLPEKMDLEIVEPFRELFKDEVRKIAEHRLGLPKEIVWRHPFPGPGLAVRILGEVSPEKLRLLREADTIFIEELKARGLYYDISQAFAVLPNAQSVGVMGDAGTYEGIIGLRAVTTNDFMTSDWFEFKKEDLTAIANRIINEVKGINRVVYDVSQKPPSTIEWE